MKAVEGQLGRVFVVRLEDGDRVPEAIEALARERGVERALCAWIGGVGSGRVVVGPRDPDASPVEPMLHPVAGVHEAAAVGTIFPDEQGRPRLHMHAALGRGGDTRTGCVRTGVEVWQLGEVVILELLGMGWIRRTDPVTGFQVLGE
ncbi:MAG: DNA-binding protein [Deferrisomatales bacterium]